MTQWYKKITKQAAVGPQDYIYNVYLGPAMLEKTDLGKNISRSQFNKNTGASRGGGPAIGSIFSNAKMDYWETILDKAQRVKAAHKDIQEFVFFKYNEKKWIEDYSKLELRAQTKEEKINGYKNLRAIYPVPDSLMNKFINEYVELVSMSYESESKNISNEEVYEKLIAPAFYARREKGEIIFVYSRGSFAQKWSQHDAIKKPFIKLRESIDIEVSKERHPLTRKLQKVKNIINYDEKALNETVAGLDHYNQLKLGDLQQRSLYEVADSTKSVRSFHEFAIRDILAICGVNFDIEVPMQIIGSNLYKDDPVVDFVLPGQELFEVFGDNRGNYQDRKEEKIDKLPKLWYIDYSGSDMYRLNVEKRTITSYCESLNTECYSNATKEPTAGPLQGKDYLATVEYRVPLLGLEHMIQLDFYWQWAMNLPLESLKAIRDKVRMIQKSPEYQPLPMTTAQYDIQQYRQDLKVPSVKEIYSSLLSGEGAPGAQGFSFPDGGGFSPEFIGKISGQELIALYFQTPEIIMPYLQEISNKIDAQSSQMIENQDLISDQEVPPEGPYEFEQSPYANNPTMIEQKDEPQMRAARSRRKIKTSSIDLSEKEFNHKIKEFIQKDSFFDRLFSLYEVPLDAVEKNLTFHITDLDGRHAKSKDDDIYINSKLMKNNNSIEDVLHFVVHEITHWLTRQREKMCYFSDPEELEAFAIGMAFELRRGQSEEKVREIYYPIIEAHFKEDGQADKMFNEFMKSAYVLNKNIFL